LEEPSSEEHEEEEVDEYEDGIDHHRLFSVLNISISHWKIEGKGRNPPGMR
jgi:hypothetical protein